MMKMKTLVAALGVAVLLAACARAEDAAQPTEKPKPKFDIPVWHPDARWVQEPFAGCSSPGHLDGPRLEMEYFSVGALGPTYRPHGAGHYVFGSYDPTTERGHTVSGGAQGYLDGPFSRARFGGWDYVVRSASAASPDGRYLYITDGYNGHVLRCLDFEKQEVHTLLPDAKGLLGLTTDPKGRLHALMNTGQFVIVNPDGKTEAGVKVEMKEQVKGAWGASLAFDDAHNRIYATAYAAKDYYIWYWDLKDGSFHGVLPIAGKGQPTRAKSEPGPFEGTLLYNQGSVTFGPDDPEKRFLYVGRVDTWCFFRLDLEKKEVWAMAADGPGGKGKPQVVKFIGKGKPSTVMIYGSGSWRPDCSIVSTVHTPYNAWRFRRIK